MGNVDEAPADAGVLSIPEVLDGRRARAGQRHVRPDDLHQTANFLYLTLDLAHAQGQPVAAARAFDAQMTRDAKRHPTLARRYLRSTRPVGAR